MADTQSRAESESTYRLYRRGVELLEDGSFEAATGPLAEAARRAPEKSSVREALGRAYFRNRQFEEAATEFEAVLETHPVNDYAHFCLGRALSLTGDVVAPAITWRWPPTCGRTAATTGSTASDWRAAPEPRWCGRSSSGSAVPRSRSRARRVSEIGPGMLVLARGCRRRHPDQADRLADKLPRLRIFDDAEGRMNEPLGRARGALREPVHPLRRDAARAIARATPPRRRPEVAEPLYEASVRRSARERGVFGARMSVELANDGPVTLMLEA